MCFYLDYELAIGAEPALCKGARIGAEPALCKGARIGSGEYNPTDLPVAGRRDAAGCLSPSCVKLKQQIEKQ